MGNYIKQCKLEYFISQKKKGRILRGIPFTKLFFVIVFNKMGHIARTALRGCIRDNGGGEKLNETFKKKIIVHITKFFFSEY